MSDIRRAIEGILSCDPSEDEFEDVEASVASLSHVDAMRLMGVCSNALSNADTAMMQDTRVGCAKVLVALLPHSREVIEKLLLERSVHSYEVHFSLFCFLNEVPSYERLAPSSSFVLSVVASYLRDVPTNDAHAVWMAGDMMGDHWPDLDEATKVLLETLTSGRFLAGKESALHGISHLLERDGLGAESRSRLIAALRAIVSVEPESELSRGANRVLRECGP